MRATLEIIDQSTEYPRARSRDFIRKPTALPQIDSKAALHTGFSFFRAFFRPEWLAQSNTNDKAVIYGKQIAPVM